MSLFRSALTAAALILGLAPAAWAQEDPIDALLNKPVVPPPAATPAPAPQVAPAPAPSEAVPTQRDAPTPVPVAPAPSHIPPPESDVTRSADAPHYAPMPLRPPPQQQLPQPYSPPRNSALTEPMRLEETGKAPDGPPSPSDLYFESRVRASFAAAQGMQGPLDGRWVVRTGGMELYDLQLVDKNQGAVEGAWRDPRRKGAADASGFIDSVQRNGGELTVRFQPHPGADPVQLSLRQLGDSWTGELIERGDRQTVTLRRN